MADEPQLLEDFMRTFAHEMFEQPSTKRNLRLGDRMSAKQRKNSMGRIKQVWWHGWYRGLR